MGEKGNIMDSDAKIELFCQSQREYLMFNGIIMMIISELDCSSSVMPREKI